MHRFYGKWITSREFVCRSERGGEDLKNKHVLFRSAFHWNGPGRVRLYYSADDYAKVYVNGKFVSQGPAPGYLWHTYYLSKDITAQLRKGENIIAFHSYYQGLVNRVWVSGDGRHGILFDVVSGGKILAYSDARVKAKTHAGYTALHTIGYDTQFMERYDSRAAECGFEKDDFDDADWEDSCVRGDANYTMVPQNIRALVVERMAPQKTGKVYDFRQEFVGTSVIRARGNRGDTVTLLYGEELNDDGSVRWKMRCNCDYREEWVLSGGEDIFETFDYKAFRYMELIAPPTVKIESVYGIARHYPVQKRAECRYDDAQLKSIYDLCVKTLKYGIQEGVLDCPSREKGQYFGDGVWSTLSHIALTGDVSMYKKFVNDAFASTFVDGGMMAQGPCAYEQKIAEFPLYIVISLQLYLQKTGDDVFVQKKKNDVLKLLSYYKNKYYDFEKGLICVYDRWNVVEWPASARDGYDFVLEQDGENYGFHNVMCGYWLFAVRACKKLYGIEVIDLDFAERAYYRTFFNEQTGYFVDSVGSNHTSIASQLFGVFSGVADGRATEILLEMIQNKRLSCSNLFITPILFLWLQREGHEKLLLDLIKDENAWLNMLREGATTTFEAFSKEKKPILRFFIRCSHFPFCF